MCPYFGACMSRRLRVPVRFLGLSVSYRQVSVAWKPLNISKQNDDARATHFLASNHLLPKSPGNKGMTRSSARNIPFSLSSIRLASKGLNFPLNFVMPTTRDINLIPLDSKRSLYSRWGSFVIKQIGDVRGSTSGCTIGLCKYPK